MSGFGESGPNFQRPAFDQIAQALGGGMSITGLSAKEPMRAGIPIGDLGGGMFAVMGIQAALIDRASTELVKMLIFLCLIVKFLCSTTWLRCKQCRALFLSL